MNVINIIVIVSLIIAAIIGYLLGFGKSLKVTTSGIFGIIISIVVCVMFGGTVKSIDAVGQLVVNINAYFAGLWSFLGKVNFGTFVYYLCFFIVVQIIRIIIVKTIAKVDDIDKNSIKVANKIVGAIFVSGFCFALCLLSLAGLRVFENSEFAINILIKIENSFLLTLYINNPIVF